MNPALRIRSRIFTLLGLLGMLLSGVGLLGTWVVHQQVRDFTAQLSQTTQLTLQRVEQTVGQVNTAVDDSALTIREFLGQLSRASIESEARSKIQTQASQLSGKLALIQQRLLATSETIELLDALVILVQRMGVSRQRLDLAELRTKLTTLETKLGAVADQLDEFPLDADQQTDRADVRQRLARLLASTGLIQQALKGLQADLKTAQEQVPLLEARWNRWVLAIAVGLSALWIWSFLAQWALWQRGRHPLTSLPTQATLARVGP